jgi:hypothetical protein
MQGGAPSSVHNQRKRPPAAAAHRDTGYDAYDDLDDDENIFDDDDEAICADVVTSARDHNHFEVVVDPKRRRAAPSTSAIQHHIADLQITNGSRYTMAARLRRRFEKHRLLTEADARRRLAVTQLYPVSDAEVATDRLAGGTTSFGTMFGGLGTEDGEVAAPMPDSDPEIEQDAATTRLPLFTATTPDVAHWNEALSEIVRSPTPPSASHALLSMAEVLRDRGQKDCFAVHPPLPTTPLPSVMLTPSEQAIIRETLAMYEAPFLAMYTGITIDINDQGRAKVTDPTSPDYCLLCDIKEEDLLPTAATNPVSAEFLRGAVKCMHEIDAMLVRAATMGRPGTLYAEIQGIYHTGVVAHLCHDPNNRFSYMVQRHGQQCIHLTVEAIRTHHEEDMGMRVSRCVTRNRVAGDLRIILHSIMEHLITTGIKGKAGIETAMKILRTYLSLTDGPATSSSLASIMATVGLETDAPQRPGMDKRRPPDNTRKRRK